jgi:hypothetical protein
MAERPELPRLRIRSRVALLVQIFSPAGKARRASNRNGIDRRANTLATGFVDTGCLRRMDSHARRGLP